MILVVGGTKGGSGKSTLAVNLTVIRASEGPDVLLIDADDQGSAIEFTRKRNERTEGNAGYTAIQSTEDDVVVQVRNLILKYDDIIIDVGGRDTVSQRAALAVAEALIMPFPPTSVDVWTDEKVIQLLKDARPFNPKLRSYAFVNKAFSSGVENDEVAQMLQEAPNPNYWQFLDTPVGSRKVFPKAFGEGYAVTEYTPRDSKAVDEIMALYLHVFDATSTQKLRKSGT